VNVVENDPHASQPVLHHGPRPRDARLTVILVHGRGDSAAGILGLTQEFDADDVAWVAPQAAGHTWYPYSFLSPIQRNEPFISSALGVLRRLIEQLDADAVSAERVILMGFSQGACLTSEFAARHARRYAGLAILSGGLIGPAGAARDYAGSFDGTPVLIGCSDVDPHIPLERVEETADILRRMQANVDQRIYPNMAHTINTDEIAAVASLLKGTGTR
jgi:predicted esterase